MVLLSSTVDRNTVDRNTVDCNPVDCNTVGYRKDIGLTYCTNRAPTTLSRPKGSLSAVEDNNSRSTVCDHRWDARLIARVIVGSHSDYCPD